MPRADDFRRELEQLLATAAELGFAAVELRARQLYQRVDDANGGNHRMPVCCSVMRQAMATDDEIVNEPPKGVGPRLTVRYRLPRQTANAVAGSSSIKRFSNESSCPQCKLKMDRTRDSITAHFLEAHDREPTAGEFHQFMTDREYDVPHADRDFVKPKIEVEGGAVSPR